MNEVIIKDLKKYMNVKDSEKNRKGEYSHSSMQVFIAVALLQIADELKRYNDWKFGETK